MYAAPTFALTAVLAYGLGRGVERLCADPPSGEVAAGVLTVAVGWFLVGVLSALPPSLLAHSVAGGLPAVATPGTTPSLANFEDPANSLFEGMSGVTGTGFSMADDPNVLPRSLQWWRSLCQSAATIALVWIATLFATALVAATVPRMASTRYTLAEVLFEVASVQGNVGLSAGVVAPTMPDVLKVAFVFSMWAGRLEFIPVAVAAKTLLREVGG